MMSCERAASPELFAVADPVIFADPRVLRNLLDTEHDTIPWCNYFQLKQSDVQPYMRKVVTTWMLEVCEEQHMEEQVLPLAVNYLDRFLAVCPIKRSQLQLLGATSMLLASKVRCCTAMHIPMLCAYTDNSITPDQVMTWEILVLSKLDWHLSAVTGFDYIDHLIERSKWGAENVFLRRHAHTLVALCATEPNLIQTPPSLIAAASLCSASRGLKMHCAGKLTRDLCLLLSCDPISLELLVRFIDSVVEQVMPPESCGDATAMHGKMAGDSYDDLTVDIYSQANTPKDVDEIYF